MTWFRIDDDLAFHPKAIAAGNQAMGVWARAGTWCSQLLTDGRIPDAIALAIGGEMDLKTLVDVRLWHAPGEECEVCEEQGVMPVPPGHHQFHDWFARNPSRADKEAQRASDRVRQQRRRRRGNGTYE